MQINEQETFDRRPEPSGGRGAVARGTRKNCCKLRCDSGNVEACCEACEICVAILAVATCICAIAGDCAD